MKQNARLHGEIDVLGLTLPRLTKRQAYRRLSETLTSPPVSRVYTPNPKMALGTKKNPSLQACFRRASLLLPDGIGLVLASHLLGNPMPERITGIDAAEFVCFCADRRHLSLALLGGERGIAERAARAIRARYPKLRICFTHHGYFEKSGKENDAVLRALRAARPDILFVCFGFPTQEEWIDRHATSIPTLRLCMGLGGALDVWSGKTRRAPSFFGAIGMEWLWRTLADPRRYRNFLDVPHFLGCVLLQKQKAVAARPQRRDF